VTIFLFFILSEERPNFVSALLIFSIVLLPAILSDYASLFAVRRTLIISRQSVCQAVALATTVGFISVTVAFIPMYILYDQTFGRFFDAVSEVFGQEKRSMWRRIVITFPLVLPATFVHLWLPLFPCGGIINRVLITFFQAVGFTRWFIKGGRQHPLEAIGLTAAILVFSVGQVMRLIGRLF
jgi:hypothetical protein